MIENRNSKHDINPLLKINTKQSAVSIRFHPYKTLLIFILYFYIIPNSLNIFLIVTNIFCTISVLFRIFLFFVGFVDKLKPKICSNKLIELNEDELPLYTILLPMYFEEEVVEDLLKSISNIDWPKKKLDVKIILEEDDLKTLNKVKSLDLDEYFELIIVPDSFPKTKAKALNYALLSTKGEYIAVFDAEDRVKPDQLKKAYIGLNDNQNSLVCVQARLVCNNENYSIITRMFSFEYILWFGYIIKALEILNLPIMLGGTSNHFKRKTLLESGGWDIYNVTEDADIGIRIWSKNDKTGFIDSETMGEGPVKSSIWIKQRSRWIKGYFQTFIVHLKNRSKLASKLGYFKAIIIAFFILSNSLFSLMASINLFLTPIYYFFINDSFLKNIYYFNILLSILIPSIQILFISFIDKKGNYFKVILDSIIFSLYLQLNSIAVIKAVWQLFTKPFYWDKTPHGFNKKI